MKQVEPGAETKPDPRTQGRGGFSPNEASVHKGGEKYPPHRKRGGVAKISAYEASILSAILKEPAPTLKGGGVQPNEASVPKGENNRPAERGGGLLPKITFYEATMLKGSTR